MGRPIGSVNKERPFNAALRLALRSGDPYRLRRIAEKLAELAESGDLAAIRELADRLDGKPAQALDHGELHVTQLTDSQLYEIAGRELKETIALPKALPPPRKP